ncbi:hypothetical protein PRZ48_011423 [Zasmidium cellare]|uniref:FAD-binding PCMH-type domain-containing protein n=1 Tax=Zasmidium cellare TaxID=395010 RepID=A0ABR0E6C7_ZASCE|nr:hypothetical protein PRZ48_011423 [Zasmidium cellare]
MGAKKNAAAADVEAIKKLLSGTSAQVFGPSDDGYSATVERWSRGAEKPSGVSVVPTTSEEVSIAVKYATEKDLDLAIKGGGHSTAGASSTDGGVLINLNKMRNVKVDADKKLLYVQGGALWHDVDQAAWKHGLATVGGTVADTGVGGLTLGGGYGHLTGTKGLVIDNVVAATVVLANGEIAKASKDENSDLFWALLGAGQNFGVTTEFVLQAYPQGEVFAGMMVFPPTPDNIEKIVATANDLYTVRDGPNGPETKARGRCGTLLALAKPPPAEGHTMILVLFAFFGTEDEAKEVLKGFYDAGPVQNTGAIHPYPKVNDLVPAVQGMRSSMKGAAFVLPIRPEFVSNVVAKYDEFLGANQDAAPSLIAWELYDPVKVTELSAGSYANRGYHLNGLVMPTWGSKENDQICRQWARDVSNMFKEELQAHGEEPGKGIDGGVGRRGHKGAVMLYGNYDQYDELSKDIFGENYERLQQIKAKFDPTNMFNKLFAITPAQARL